MACIVSPEPDPAERTFIFSVGLYPPNQVAPALMLTTSRTVHKERLAPWKLTDRMHECIQNAADSFIGLRAEPGPGPETFRKLLSAIRNGNLLKHQADWSHAKLMTCYAEAALSKRKHKELTLELDQARADLAGTVGKEVEALNRELADSRRLLDAASIARDHFREAMQDAEEERRRVEAIAGKQVEDLVRELADVRADLAASVATSEGFLQQLLDADDRWRKSELDLAHQTCILTSAKQALEDCQDRCGRLASVITTG
jgi:hypothetical protein